MNVYDFDNTIFKGDSTLRFCAYCFLRVPRTWRRIPALIYHALFTYRRDQQMFTQRAFGLLADLRAPEALIARFWDANMGRVKRFYALNAQPDDVIISASPEFLLAPACAHLGVNTLIASRMDMRTGAYTGLKCKGEEKVRRYREALGDAPIDEFYSDSLSDTPLARIARRAFMVKGEHISPWKF